MLLYGPRGALFLTSETPLCVSRTSARQSRRALAPDLVLGVMAKLAKTPVHQGGGLHGEPIFTQADPDAVSLWSGNSPSQKMLPVLS